jgi:hypothetical protein
MKIFPAIGFEINSNCNRDCWFCNRLGDTQNRRFDKQGRHVIKQMPMEKLEDLSDQLVAINYQGLVMLNHMSEPVLDPRLPDIVRMLHGKGLRVRLYTNGDVMWKNQELCDVLAKHCNSIVVGIYDVQDMTPQDIHNRQIEWRKKLRGCDVTFSVATQRYPRVFSKHMDKPTYPDGDCHQPQQIMMIDYDGRVCLCCEDVNNSFDLGNAFEARMLEIGSSP